MNLNMMEQRISADDIADMDKRYRVNFINSLPGFKSANLIGTDNGEGHTNLAVFSSVIHMGSNPPLFGMVTRPTVVPRHTYRNLKASGHFTLNHVNPTIFKSAHQSSARYPEEISEFDAVGLTPIYSENIKAPYVRESSIKIGLELVEEHNITANGTILVIGRVLELFLTKDIIGEDGFLDLEKAETICISGLDAYHKTQKLDRLPYAKP